MATNPYITNNQVAGSYTYRKETMGSPEQEANKRAMAELGALAANPMNRNIQGNPFAEFTQGRINLEEAKRRYGQALAENPFDPTKGPQINTGSGFQTIQNFKT